jgi:hypothetical protein
MAVKEITLPASTGYTGYERKIVSYILKFTDEERDDLFGLLKNYDKARVKKFIDDLETDLNFANWVIKRPKPKDQISMLNNLLSPLEEVQRWLLQIVRHRRSFQILPPRRCDFLDDYLKNPGHSRPQINAAVRKQTMAILPALEELIKTLKSAIEIEKIKRGHPKADNIKLCFQIAKTFRKNFERPRFSVGPFHDLVAYCFDIMGIKNKDESFNRVIRSALGDLPH